MTTEPCNVSMDELLDYRFGELEKSASEGSNN